MVSDRNVDKFKNTSKIGYVEEKNSSGAAINY